MSIIFYYTGATVWLIITLLIIYKLHLLLYGHSTVYNYMFECLCLPYYFYQANILNKKQAEWFIKVSQKTKTPIIANLIRSFLKKKHGIT